MPEEQATQSPPPDQRESAGASTIDVASFAGSITSTGTAVSHPAPRPESE